MIFFHSLTVGSVLSSVSLDIKDFILLKTIKVSPPKDDLQIL